MKEITHEADFCVVGGGLSGMCAAIAAARHGARTVLMHDRPVPGGNASSEIRMHICGADRGDALGLRETGIVEELELENKFRNPQCSYSIWDSVLYGAVKNQPNLTTLLNCSCVEARMDGSRVLSARGWQGTAETWHTVRATLFADCSGDSVLGPLTGAQLRSGRESRDEFGESIEPETADDKTMGMSCLIQVREHDRPVPFTAPSWAAKVGDLEGLHVPQRRHDMRGGTNYWWLELGGEEDPIHDTESLRDRLVPLALGVWDHIKNGGDHGADNWSLEWMGFLPGKRESRRYVGDHILTQNDVASGGAFDDIVAYGGWSMDDHHPAGILYPGDPTIFHPAPQPYGIPYRCLYSRNVENLLCAGRNISATHAALSSTRVMGTCAILGQAAGTAAALAVRDGLTPRQVGQGRIRELQEALMEDDCWLPGRVRAVAELSLRAALTADAGDPSPLLSGIDRSLDGRDNGWTGRWIRLLWERDETPASIRLVFDSDLARPEKNMPCRWPVGGYHITPPAPLARDFDVDILRDGRWETLHAVRDNYQRLVRLPAGGVCRGVRVRLIRDWGGRPDVRMFALEAR
ncbi:MAG: FAD-dependent oxidoreductase [Christensenellales bacterium]|jgi:hypothetical protein